MENPLAAELTYCMIKMFYSDADVSLSETTVVTTDHNVSLSVLPLTQSEWLHFMNSILSPLNALK